MLVSGGGGLLQDKTSARSLRFYLGVIALAKRSDTAWWSTGSRSDRSAPRGNALLPACCTVFPIAVRDETSQRLLERLELPSTLVADSALLLPPATGHSR